jgi:hypothetical protein
VLAKEGKVLAKEGMRYLLDKSEGHFITDIAFNEIFIRRECGIG